MFLRKKRRVCAAHYFVYLLHSLKNHCFLLIAFKKTLCILWKVVRMHRKISDFGQF